MLIIVMRKKKGDRKQWNKYTGLVWALDLSEPHFPSVLGRAVVRA